VGFNGNYVEYNSSLSSLATRRFIAVPWIDPYANVMICYGMTIGSLYQSSLMEILGPRECYRQSQ